MDKKRVQQIKEEFDMVVQTLENEQVEFYERWNHVKPGIMRHRIILLRSTK